MEKQYHIGDAMTQVSSAELQKSFGIYKDLALEKPVRISLYGQPKLVLLSYEHYQSLVMDAPKNDMISGDEAPDDPTD